MQQIYAPSLLVGKSPGIIFIQGPSDYNNMYIHKSFDRYIKNRLIPI
jgi:hypothetical protein